MKNKEVAADDKTKFIKESDEQSKPESNECNYSSIN
jgi:hypothetical protein